ncbi:MAG: hypothetical protein WCA32_02150 [Chromatiaceae bacterium]
MSRWVDAAAPEASVPKQRVGVDLEGMAVVAIGFLAPHGAWRPVEDGPPEVELLWRIPGACADVHEDQESRTADPLSPRNAKVG